MIKVTKVDGEEIYINHHFIESMEANPNTTIKIHEGTTFVVMESIPDVLEQMRQWDALTNVFGGTAASSNDLPPEDAKA